MVFTGKSLTDNTPAARPCGGGSCLSLSARLSFARPNLVCANPRTRRALGVQGPQQDFSKLSLPRQTRGPVPKLLKTHARRANPARHALPLRVRFASTLP